MASKNISIKINNNWYNFPDAYYTISNQPITTEYTMADGSLAEDWIGIRKVISCTLNYMPAQTLTTINTALNAGGYYSVKYQDIDGTDHTEDFKVAPFTPSVFKFGANNVAMWTNISVTMTGRTVS